MRKEDKQKKLIEKSIKNMLKLFPQVERVENPESYKAEFGAFRLPIPEAGYYNFWIDRDDIKRGYAPSFSVFGKFEQEKLAYFIGIDCNKFSGKYNWHFSNDYKTLAGIIYSILDDFKKAKQKLGG